MPLELVICSVVWLTWLPWRETLPISMPWKEYGTTCLPRNSSLREVSAVVLKVKASVLTMNWTTIPLIVRPVPPLPTCIGTIVCSWQQENRSTWMCANVHYTIMYWVAFRFQVIISSMTTPWRVTENMGVPVGLVALVVLATLRDSWLRFLTTSMPNKEKTFTWISMCKERQRLVTLNWNKSPNTLGTDKWRFAWIREVESLPLSCACQVGWRKTPSAMIYIPIWIMPNRMAWVWMVRHSIPKTATISRLPVLGRRVTW